MSSLFDRRDFLRLCSASAAFLTRAALSWLGELAAHRTSASVTSALRRQLLSRAVALGPSWLAGERTGEHERRPEHGVAGERQLDPGREDPDPGVAALARRQDEDGLRQVQLAREPRHHALVEGGPVGEDGEAVALERRVGEDVGDHIRVGTGSHPGTPRVGPAGAGGCRESLRSHCAASFALSASRSARRPARIVSSPLRKFASAGSLAIRRLSERIVGSGCSGPTSIAKPASSASA